MADTKTTALTELASGGQDDGDQMPIVDVSDTTQGAGGSLKRFAWSSIKAGLKTYFDTLYLSVTGAISSAVGTLTTDVKALSQTATWNNAAVTFTGWKLNVTDTTSNASSLLVDLQVGGVSKFKVDKSGVIRVTGTGTSTTLGANGYGDSLSCSGNIVLSGVETYGNGVVSRSSSGFIKLAASNYLGWSNSSADGSATIDTYLYRDAAAALAQRNGTNAQTTNRYRSYTDASNYSRVTEKWNTSTAIYHAEGLGTGSDGSVAFNDAALATNATVGFVMIPSCAGAPTGVPADIPTGQVPLVFDSTNNKIYAYDGGWISTAALT